MYVAILNNTITYQKSLIDAVIVQIADSRSNYIFKTFNPYQRLIEYLHDVEPEIKDAVLKHRFYVEYKIMDVISR